MGGVNSPGINPGATWVAPSGAFIVHKGRRYIRQHADRDDPSPRHPQAATPLAQGHRSRNLSFFRPALESQTFSASSPCGAAVITFGNPVLVALRADDDRKVKCHLAKKRAGIRSGPWEGDRSGIERQTVRTPAGMGTEFENDTPKSSRNKHSTTLAQAPAG